MSCVGCWIHWILDLGYVGSFQSLHNIQINCESGQEVGYESPILEQILWPYSD